MWRGVGVCVCGGGERRVVVGGGTGVGEGVNR